MPTKLLKTWKYTSAKGRAEREPWSLLAHGQYTTACLTAASILRYGNSAWPVVTTATDGHVAFWSLTETSRNLACHCIQPVHQSSIKAIAKWKLTDSAWLIVTGGDDNALGICVVAMDEETEEPKSSTLSIPRAHAAAITAVEILLGRSLHGSDNRFDLTVATASNDQRVKLWDIKVDMRKPGVQGVRVRREANHFSAVADISSMAVLPSQDVDEERVVKILICGVGMEVWRVSY